jgi:hypothetical protein
VLRRSQAEAENLRKYDDLFGVAFLTMLFTCVCM